ncbi:MAG: DUF3313 domain-containing protein [Gammaproteobacteria bacterium]|nr:DUF3313 domain-containing protein [Gammaproteobacteria bacterium]
MFDLTHKYRTLLAVLFLGPLGCANLSPTQSGFLTDYPAMQNDTPLQRSFHAPDHKLRDYTQLSIEPVRVLVADESQHSEQLHALAQRFHLYLQNDLQPLFHQGSATKHKDLRLTAAITAIDSSSFNLNLLSTVFLFAPLDTGGISVELEIQDVETGETLYTQTRSVNGSIIQFRASFESYGHADIGLQTISKDLTKIVTEPYPAARLLSSTSPYKKGV